MPMVPQRYGMGSVLDPADEGSIDGKQRKLLWLKPEVAIFPVQSCSSLPASHQAVLACLFPIRVLRAVKVNVFGR